MVSSLTPYDLPFLPKWGFHMPQYTRMVISPQRVIQHTSCLVLWYGFRGWRIDGGRPRSWKISNGHICATGHPIHFMFGSRVGFQGRRIEWRYFLLHQIQVGGRPPSWIISNGHISATAHSISIHLYSAHRAVIFAIAQLSCYFSLYMCSVS